MGAKAPSFVEMMMMSDDVVKNEVKVGSVVMLSSGSGQMTVIEVGSDGVRCVYWNDSVSCVNHTTAIPVECFMVVR